MASGKHTTPTQLDLSFGPHEAWKPVPGYEGSYEVSNLGRIKSLSRLVPQGKQLRQTKECILVQDTSFGYKRINLSVRGKSRKVMVHVIVLHAFTGSRPHGYTVNHIDGNKSNNVLSNLEWLTLSENHSHACAIGVRRAGERHPLAKLTTHRVHQIRAMFANGATITALALSFGVSRRGIGRVVKHQSWRHIPQGVS